MDRATNPPLGTIRRMLPYAAVAAAVLAAATIDLVAASLFAVTALGLLAWNQQLRNQVVHATRRLDAVRVDHSPGK